MHLSTFADCVYAAFIIISIDAVMKLHEKKQNKKIQKARQIGVCGEMGKCFQQLLHLQCYKFSACARTWAYTKRSVTNTFTAMGWIDFEKH